MKKVTQFFVHRVAPALFWMLVLAAPAAAQAPDAEAVAAQIQELLFQLMLVGGPVMLLVGFAMIFAGGVNPQWKQRGIEIIKWTFLGAVGIAVAQGVLWSVIRPLLSGAAGG